MEAPEYLDLDEIDFSDDSVYSVTSLKNIPELSRRGDGPGEDRQAPAIPWSRGGSSLGGGGIKPSGMAEVHSKFRPVKRVSPLKHQPDTSDAETDGKAQGSPGHGEDSKEEPPPDKPSEAGGEGAGGGKARAAGAGGGGGGGGPLFGELEHYDLDMDEILDVPYIKSSQQMSTLPRAHQDKRGAGGGLGVGGAGKTSTLPHSESLSGATPYCVLSPVKWSDMRKSKSMEADYHLRPSVGPYDPPGPLSCSGLSDTDKLASRVYPDSQGHKLGLGGAMDPAGGQAMMFPLPGGSGGRQEGGGKVWGGGGPEGSKTWAGTGSRSHGGEVDEETKKNQNIINIIREGQISLLPHLAAENLELIRDEHGNNLLHISAWFGHADCLQHLTSLLGEDGLTERNGQQLTPAGLGVKNGHLECVRWMVSETEAIAELSCTRDHPSLIHYAARYGQEKVLLWLLQFMQEQAISLDEVDQHGNSAVHVAAQYGHLTCIQTLVEYGSNVTVNNQQGERPSQSAERQGHTTCARYLVVVETCMSLASQVVKLTKQLNEQAVERLALQNQVQRLLDPTKGEGTPSRSPSSHQPSGEVWPEMTLTAEGTPGDSHWVVRQGSLAADSVLRQLLGKEPPPGAAGGGANPPGPLRRAGLAERRELKLARLKQIMQRSLSESDSDVYPPEEGKNGAPPTSGPRPERPNHLPIAEGEEPISNHQPLAMKAKLAFSHGTAKSVDGGYDPSPTSDRSDQDAPGEASGEFPDLHGQKVATSPKSALKSPSSRRKTSQNLRLRVTFDEQVNHKPQEPEAKGAHGKESSGRTTTSSESSDTWKRPFGTFRSIMESLSGSQNSSSSNNNNNNSQSASTVKQHSGSGTLQSSANRKSTETKAGTPSKTRNKSSAV